MRKSVDSLSGGALLPLSKKPVAIASIVAAIVLTVASTAWAAGTHEAKTSAESSGSANPATGPAPTSAQSAVAGTESIQAAVEAVNRVDGPSVVNITSTLVVQQDFHSQPVPEVALGSGFVYDTHGNVVTNYHVIANATTVVVTLSDGENFQGKIIGADPSTDLAVVHIDGAKLPPPLKLGDSSAVQVGQFVVALGNPFGLSNTLTFGVISATQRNIQSPNGQFLAEALQTDAPINPGNSGGPLITLGREVIGINSQIVSPNEASSGIGFAIASNIIKTIVPQLIKSGRVDHPFIGVTGVDLSPTLSSLLASAGARVPVDQGLLITQVVPGSPAAKAGLKGATVVVAVGNDQIPVGGDIIVSINGTRVADFAELDAYVQTNTKVGQQVTLTVNRNGVEKTFSVTLAARPQSTND